MFKDINEIFFKKYCLLFLCNKSCNNIVDCNIFKSFLIVKYIIINKNIFRREKIIDISLIIVVFRYKI